MSMNKKEYELLNETVYTKVLPNGLTVILLPKKEYSKTYAIFSTKYGSIDDTFIPLNKKEKVTVPKGIAHFLEHKLFEKEGYDVFSKFSEFGASANAFTSFTKTAYLFSASDNISENIETLIDFVQEPYFSDESVEKEKGIIEQEIKMYDDNPGWQSFTGTVQALFHNYPIIHDIAGTVDSIMQITKDDLYTCYDTFYHPQNMVLFVAGPIDEEKIMTLIENNQADKSFEEQHPIERFFPEEREDVAIKNHTIHMPVSIPKCTVGIKEIWQRTSSKDLLEKEILLRLTLDYLFAKGGKFYEILYEEDLIDSSFSYSSTLETDYGYTFIGGNCVNPDKFAERTKELLLSTKQMKISAEDVNLIKKRRIGLLLRQMNSLEFVANQFVDYHLLDIDFFTMIHEVESMTVEQVNAFLNEWISEERIAICKIVNND